MVKRKAVVLLSGGLDSATVLALAREQGFEALALSFDYGQRHACELASARQVAAALGAAGHWILPLNLALWGGSALTDPTIPVPDAAASHGIPETYVPARNLVFLSLAAACAEASGARDLFIGVNSVDYSGYPDCRPAFIKSFTRTVNLATRAADEDWKFEVHAPLQHLSKAEIIREGVRLGVDYGLTVSCYHPDAEGRACGRCASCALRREGFAAAGVPDPTRYQG